MKKRRILIAEDERIVAHDIQMGLRRLGYTVSGIVASGEEAIKKTEEAQPDLVLVDIVLEGNIDGIKAAEIIRSRFNIPIVYLTAYADKNTIERAKKTEPYGYIVKPFEDRELNSIIEIALYRHKIRNMIRESEEKYRELADSISDIFFAMDKDFRYTYWNKASEKLTGIKAKDALGKSIMEIFPDNEETRRAKKAYQKVLRTKKSQTFINEYSLAGKQYFFEISAYPSRRGLSVFVRDITEQKRIENDLRESEAFNFALFQYSPAETIVVDHAGKIIKTNLARRKSGDRLPNIGDVMYKDYAGKHEINMHAELIKCIRSGKKKDFPELKYGDKFLCITIAPFPMGAIITSQDVTERKRTEQALRDSKELFEKTFISQRDAIFLLDSTTPPKILDCNPVTTEIFGYDRQEILGHTTSFLHCDEASLKKFQEQLYPTVSKQGFFHLPEFKMKRKDGTIFFTEHSVLPLEDDQGNRMGWVSVIRDITEQKQAENALRESEERYRAIFEQAADSILLVDAETGALVEFNDQAHKNLGYTRKEFENLKIPDFEVIESREEVAKHINKITKEGSDTFETKHRTKTGDIRDILVSSSAISAGGKNFAQSILRDITEQKQSEEALRKAEQEIRLIANNVPALLSYVDSHGCYRFVNKVYEELFGLPQNKIIGKHWRQVLGEDTYKKIKGYVRAALSGKQVDYEEELPYKYGGTRWMSASYIPEIDEEGNVAGFFALVTDITERKKAEEELRKSREQLRNLAAHLQAVREQERTLVAREMHDELGQSLTALKMDLSWLEIRISKKQKSLLEKMKSMTKLVDETLQSVKRISTELRPGLLDDIGLPSAIEWQAEEFENRMGIKCAVTIIPEDMILDSECSTAIFRIFQETLTNVARHSHATQVKVGLKAKAGKIELRVRDNGKGITEKQIANPKSFGLIGIRERAHFLGGNVEIRGIPGKGTTVIATIPLSKEREAQ